MSNNEPSSEKRIATEQPSLHLNGVAPDDLNAEVLLGIHDLFDEHDLPLRSISVERRRKRLPNVGVRRFRY
ncbi:hypothetical protein [Haladaptatus sp. T7]|uniref:hypothetical protein n=1 Tax=Haladaptatus sp. T7 TaxID=2029368 RepID=UPI0021A25833|nr:hypothetical protein [Haladaptatus sp. T7]GKZ13929.1 hypothetical protein HAL_18100 [Haladaptatus sp. T7]